MGISKVTLSRSFSFKLSLYISSFSFIINNCLFLLYHSYPEAHPKIFLLKFNLFEIRILDFFVYSLLIFFLTTAVFYVIHAKDLTLIKIIIGGLILFSIFVFYSVFIPLSLLFFVTFMENIGIYVIITYIRLLDPFESELKETSLNKEALALLHGEWLELLKLAITLFVSVIIGGVSATVAIVMGAGAGKIGGTILWGYPMGQMLIIGIMILFGTLGVGFGVISFCLYILRKIRKEMSHATN